MLCQFSRTDTTYCGPYKNYAFFDRPASAMGDFLIYLKEFFREFESTGTICSSSPWAASVLSAPAREYKAPRRILEVGPGSGVVTKFLLRNMQDEDELTICEINPRFMDALKKKLESNEYYQKHKDRVSFFLGPIQDLDTDKPYDAIVCAVPFLNFSLDVVEEIFAKLFSLSHKNTVMTYFEYIGLRQVGMLLSPPKRRSRLKSIHSYFDKLFSSHRHSRKKVWLNILPINVYRLELGSTV